METLQIEDYSERHWQDFVQIMSKAIEGEEVEGGRLETISK
jgi:hypothetical protein